MPRSRKWTTDEEVSLLAWLDFTLDHPKYNFKETISSHLGNAFTFEECDKALWRIWDTRIGPEWPKGVSKKQLKIDKSIYTQGSRCLDYMLDEDRQKIEIARQSLEDTFFEAPTRVLRGSSKRGRSQSTGGLSQSTPCTGKKLKSGKKIRISGPKSPSSVKQESSIKQESSVKQEPVVKQESDTPSPTPSRKSIQKRKMKGVSEPKKKVAVVIKYSDNASPTLSNTLGAKQASQASRKTTIDDSDGSSAILSLSDVSLGTEKAEEPSQNSTSVQQHTPNRGGRQVVDRVSDTLSTENLNTQLTGAISEIETLREALSGKEDDEKGQLATIEQMEKEISRMTTAQTQRDAQNSGPMEKTVANYLKQIENLNTELDNRQYFGQFTSLALNSRRQFGTTKIEEQFEQIYRDSQQVMTGRDDDVIPYVPDIPDDGPLRQLVADVLGVDVCGTQIDISGVNPRAWIRALAMAALRRWVFETDFPQFDSEPSETLHHFRKAVFQQDGPLALRNLDLASLSSQVNDQTFRQKLVPQRAKELTIKLSQVLAPFFTDPQSDSPQQSWDGFATWGDEQGIWQSRKLRLLRVFTEALIAKADSCLNLEDYEMAIFPPGSEHNQTAMAVETMEGVSAVPRSDGYISVKICVQAAVYVYPKMAPSDSFSKTLMPMNFVRKTEEERAVVTPLVKAVVVLS